MSRYLGAFFAGAAAFFIARGTGMPVWMDWPRDWSTDATDVGVLVMVAVLLLTTRKAKP